MPGKLYTQQKSRRNGANKAGSTQMKQATQFSSFLSVLIWPVMKIDAVLHALFEYLDFYLHIFLFPIFFFTGYPRRVVILRYFTSITFTLCLCVLAYFCRGSIVTITTEVLMKAKNLLPGSRLDINQLEERLTSLDEKVQDLFEAHKQVLEKNTLMLTTLNKRVAANFEQGEQIAKSMSRTQTRNLLLQSFSILQPVFYYLIRP